MANRMKEEERIEKIIRSLLRLPGNRRCINCSSLGPQYVCTTFLTFVCTNCSGIHREFTHRVKSISMAKFSAEEVSALQAGGNERARQLYFKEWDPQRHFHPDGSDLHRLRDFIKHVYVDRKYTGEKSIEKLPKLRLNNKEETYESRKVSSGGSRSQSNDKRSEKQSSKRSSPGRRSEDGFKYYYDERRSPRYNQENSRQGGSRRSHARFEIVDDRVRDGQHGSRRSSNTESRLGIRSPEFQQNMDRSRSPVVRPVRDILGEDAPLQVGEHSKANDGKDVDDSAHKQKIASSSDQGSIDRNPVSLIDWSAESEPPDAANVPQTQQMDDGSKASFASPAKEKAAQAPTANTLDFLLFELSVPSSEPAGTNICEGPSSDYAPSTAIPADGFSSAAPVGQIELLNTISSFTTTETTINVPEQPSDGGPPQAAPSRNGDSTIQVSDKQQLPSMQQYHPTAYPVANGSCITQQTSPPVGALNNQPWISSSLPTTQEPFSASAELSSEAVSKSAHDTSSRKELPADLFTASYSSVPASIPGWQNRPPYGMGFGMQHYPNAMPVPAAKSTNPFDLNDEKTLLPAPPFPSMAPLQGVLPNSSPAPSGLWHAPSVGTQYSGLMAPQSPSFASAMPPGASTGLQVHNNMPSSRPQGVSDFSGNGGVFGSLNTTQQQSTGEYSALNHPNSSSSAGGNPFG